MPTYTTMTAAARTRVLRLDHTGATPVTTLTDQDTAAHLADALTFVGTDLPGTVTTVLEATGVGLPDPTAWEWDEETQLGDWLTAPAPTDPVDATRRVLAELTNPTAASSPLGQLPTVLTDLPDPVVRAVHAELTAVLTGYDDVPVVAHVYDRKWHDANWQVLVTAALNRAPRDVIERVVGTGYAGDLLQDLEERGDVEVPAAVTAAADQGYLRVDLHPGQLRAWLTRHHPDLVATVSA